MSKSKYSTTNHDGRCTHGTTLGSYCHECAAPTDTQTDIKAIREHLELCKAMGDTSTSTRYCGELLKMVSELEYDLSMAKHATATKHTKLVKAKAQLTAAEATIERVRGLPDKLRNDMPHTTAQRWLNKCADMVEAALKD